MLGYTEFCLIIAFTIQYGYSIDLYSAPKLNREHRIQKRQTTGQCLSNQFSCDKTACLNKTSTCDGFFDCTDESDESWDTCHDRTCSNSRFRCKSGGCIHKNKLCDGFLSCVDGDDETIENCKNNVCSSGKFRCSYGGCIRQSKTCNGVQDCQDGSDESTILCSKDTVTTSTTNAPVTNTVTKKVNVIPDTKECTLPPITPDKAYTVTCPVRNSCGTKPGDKVMEYTVLLSRCNPGYTVYPDGKVTSNNNNNMVSTCFGGSWSNVAQCKKICDDLSSLDLDLTCSQYLHGPRVPCTGILLEGAAVVPRCKPQYYVNYRVPYRHVTCLKDGKWNKEFFQCSPTCGRTSASVVELIVQGKKEKRGEAPWNVAIYSSEGSKDPQFICGGTLISAELVISAAHCFFDQTYQRKSDARFFTIIVGKTTIDFDKMDYNATRKYLVKAIHFADTPFTGERTGYVSDIAILQLSDRIALSEDVLPACVRWNEKDRFDPGGKVTFGKLSGFGVTETGSLAKVLLTAELPYINFTDCKRRVGEDFKDSISFDKFCAGNETGAGARVGDSGGGLIFKDEKDGFFYLRGVVSTREPGESSIATFTDIALYISWIRKVVSTVDRSAINDDTLVNVKTQL